MPVKVEIIVRGREHEEALPKKRSLLYQPPLAARLDTSRTRFVAGEMILDEVMAPPTEAKLEVTSEEAAIHWRDEIRAMGHEVVGDCWTCSLFRNESRILSSDLILDAMAATRATFGDPPAGGFLTFVDERKIASPNPGYCFKIVGFEEVGRTKDRDLVALRLAPEALPAPAAALEFQISLPPG